MQRPRHARDRCGGDVVITTGPKINKVADLTKK